MRACAALLSGLLAAPLAFADEPSAASPVRTITHADIESRYADSDSRFAEIDGVRLHYKDQGQGPAILLIHGSLGDTRDWDGWVRVLAPRRRVIRMDLPGFGLSGVIANDNYSIDRSQSLIDGLMDALAIDRFAIAGVSYGGPVAFRYAATRTSRITALIILNSAGIESGKQQVDPKSGARDYYRNVSSSAALTREFIETALRKSFNKPERIPAGMIDRKLDLMNVVGRDREGALMIAQYVRGNPQRVLAHVRAPTLVLWGAAERSLSQSTADLFVAALTNAQHVTRVMQPEGDHYMHVELADETGRKALHFLETAGYTAIGIDLGVIAK